MLTVGTSTIFFDEFPMPPSENNLYKNVSFGQRGRGRCKTKEHLDFVKEVEVYQMLNARKLIEARDKIQDWLDKGLELSIMSQYYFPRSKLYTLKGELKILDASNRTKPVNDQISNLLGIDDKLFMSGSYRKIEGSLHCKILVIAGKQASWS